MWLQSDGAISNRRAINHTNLSILEGLATLIGSHLTREPTASPVLTKWWKSELILATNFGSLCPKVTKVGSQNFGYQIWFCTRLLNKKGVTEMTSSLLAALQLVLTEPGAAGDDKVDTLISCQMLIARLWYLHC